MRRPIQITPDEFDHHQQGLTFDDLEDEAFHSEVYGLDTKTALCQVLASLCHFVITVTDLVQIVYPSEQQQYPTAEECRVKLNKLEKAKSALLQWELNWMAHMEGKDFYLHSSLALCANLLSIYYQYEPFYHITKSQAANAHSDLLAWHCQTTHVPLSAPQAH